MDDESRRAAWQAKVRAIAVMSRTTGRGRTQADHTEEAKDDGHNKEEDDDEVKPEDKLEKQGGGQRFRRDGFVLP